MSTIVPPPAGEQVPNAQACPVCSTPSISEKVTGHNGVLSANHLCRAGHIWLVRWMAVAS